MLNTSRAASSALAEGFRLELKIGLYPLHFPFFCELLGLLLASLGIAVKRPGVAMGEAVEVLEITSEVGEIAVAPGDEGLASVARTILAACLGKVYKTRPT